MVAYIELILENRIFILQLFKILSSRNSSSEDDHHLPVCWSSWALHRKCWVSITLELFGK